MKDKETISQWKRLPTTASRTVIFPPLHFCLLQVIPSNLHFSSNLTFLQSPSTMFGIYLIILSNSILHFLFCSFLWLESILFCVSTYLSKTDGIFEWESRGVLNLLSGFHTHICAHLCVLPITSVSFISSVQYYVAQFLKILCCFLVFESQMIRVACEGSQTELDQNVTITHSLCSHTHCLMTRYTVRMYMCRDERLHTAEPPAAEI